MKAEWNGAVLEESGPHDRAGWLPLLPARGGTHGGLRPAPRSESDLECPHGVRFFDVADGEREALRMAWSYEAPQPSHHAIGQWIGFWKEVQLTP